LARLIASKAWLYTHIALCLIGVVFVASSWLASRGWLNAGILQQCFRFAALALLTLANFRRRLVDPHHRLEKMPTASTTPPSPLPTMDQEGRRPQRQIFP